MLHVLKPIIAIEEKDITESIEKLENISKKINSKKITDENPAIKLAKWINDTPVVYYPWGLESVGIRFKNSLQENSKIQAVIEDVIESCHNGIVTWDKQNDFQPILIRGKDDFEKNQREMGNFKRIFQ